MMNSTEVFLGSEGVGTAGGPVEGGVPTGVEDAACIPVVVVRKVVFGLAWGR